MAPSFIMVGRVYFEGDIRTMYIKKLALLSVALVTLVVVALAQHDSSNDKKPLSPPAKAEATIGGKQVTIDYSAPSARGRKIFGGLVPYDKVWRTGANAATTLTTGTDLVIG